MATNVADDQSFPEKMLFTAANRAMTIAGATLGSPAIEPVRS